MTKSVTVKRRFYVQRGESNRRQVRPGTNPEIATVGVPRISRLMALAIRLDQMVKDGIVSDRAELARLGHISRARLTQIMNLLQLAPDIQESLLILPSTTCGREQVTERDMRPIIAIVGWSQQRKIWRRSVPLPTQ
jgi:hypothetical protein